MSNNFQKNRNIRVFISSTFKDMSKERTYLANNIFPLLRGLCNKRNLEFSELDLRWGITEEASRNGKVTEICLREIERTRPFFIGLLGDRYGWIPSHKELELNPILETDFPWIKEDLNKGLSMTEIEMQFGALRLKEPINAHFFIRSLDSTIYDDSQNTSISDDSPKLANLKNQIYNQDSYPVKQYNSLEILGSQVLEWFSELIERLYPIEGLSSLEEQQIEQSNFIRLKTTLYAPDPLLFQTLDNFVSGSGQKLLITGEIGIGKSSLLANWCAARKNSISIIDHFAGAKGKYNTPLDLIERIVSEIHKLSPETTEEYYIGSGINFQELSISESRQILRDAMLATFHKKIPWVLVVDEIDKTLSRKVENWIPIIPPNIKIIASTSIKNTDLRHEFTNHGDYQEWILTDLSEKTLPIFITKYLSHYGKELPLDIIVEIMGNEKMKNPLLLRTLLEEIRVFGIHEQLEERIDYYLSAYSVEDFFDRILERMEQEFTNEAGENYVAKILSVIAVSQNGMYENDVHTITGVFPVYWSRLYNAFDMHFSYKEGLINFSHEYINRSIWKRYLHDIDKVDEYREMIINYFLSVQTSFKKNNDRYDLHSGLDEVAWQLYKYEGYKQLFDYLSKPEIFILIAQNCGESLPLYWRELAKVGYDIKDYLSLDLSDEKQKNIAYYYSELGNFCKYMEWYEQSVIFFEKSIEFYKRLYEEDAQFINALSGCYNNITLSLNKLNQWDKSIDMGKKAMSIAVDMSHIEPEENLTVIAILNNLADIYEHTNEYNKAKDCYEQALKACKLVPDQSSRKYLLRLCTTYNNLAYLHYKYINDYKSAEYNYNLSLTVCQIQDNLGFSPDVYLNANVHSNMFDIYMAMGNMEKAETSLFEALRYNRTLATGNSSFIPKVYSNYINLTALRIENRDYEKAIQAGQVGLEFLDTLNNDSETEEYVSCRAKLHQNIGGAYLKLKDLDKAIEFIETAVTTYTDLYKTFGTKYMPDLANGLDALATAYYEAENLEAALEALEMATCLFQHLCEHSPEEFNISLSLISYRYGILLLTVSLDKEKGLILVKHALLIASKYKDSPMLQEVILNAPRILAK